MPEGTEVDSRPLNAFMGTGTVHNAALEAEKATEPAESSSFKAMRESIKAKDRELAEARRELALEKSGVDLEHPHGKLFVRPIADRWGDSVPTPLEIRAQARFYGIPMKGETPVPVEVEEDDD